MAKVYIAEYAGLGLVQADGAVAITPAQPTATQVLDTAAATGNINVLGAITAGSLYVNGVYNNVPLTGGSGSGATANITVSGGGVTAVQLVNRGTGYTAANSLSASNAFLGGAGSGFAVTVTSIFQQAAFQSSSRLVEIHTDGIMSLAWGTDPIAAATDMRYAANERKLFALPAVIPGTLANPTPIKVSAITNT